MRRLRMSLPRRAPACAGVPRSRRFGRRPGRRQARGQVYCVLLVRHAVRLHGYLTGLLADSASTDLVRLLLQDPSAGHTVRGLAGLTGRAVATTARAVQRLEDRGIVRVVPKGRSHIVRPNMKSYALKRVIAPAIRAEESSYDAMLGVLRRGLARKPCSITSAAVFGSTARGEDHDRSDVDLLVVSDSYEDAVEATMGPSDDIHSMFDLPLKPVIYDMDQFAEGKGKYFLASVLARYDMVYGMDLRDM